MTDPTNGPSEQQSRFARLDTLFKGALARAPHEREAWLRERCGDDERLLREVLDLLETDARSGTFLETPALGANFDLGTGTAETMPERIGPYRVLRVLGEGGMGVVYEAEQAEPKRRVAIKLIRGGLADEDMRRRFRYEAELLGRLRDPRIAQIFEAGTDEQGRPYFAMELVEGRPLDSARDMDLRARCTLMADIADAVHHAHQRGVIHRDLKPGNVLVQRDGRPKVLDFGVARAAEREPGATLYTTAGQIIGTPAYMSPEQASGDPERVDARTDVYALGAIAFELLGGRPPIDVAGMAPLQAINTVREREPARLSTIVRASRGDLETIVHKALAKEPERRYASAAEFAADLRRYLNDEPVIARPTTIGYQLTKFARRNRGLVGAAGVALSALVVATGVSVAFAMRASDAREAEASARAKAEARFNQVRELARTMIFDIERRLRDVPGATSAREALIATAVRYLDALSSAEEADADLLHEVAESYLRIHDVQGGTASASLGDTESALASLEKAKTIFRRLLEADPQSERDRVWLSAALKFEAELLMALGRGEDAMARLDEAETIGREMLETDPASVVAARDLMLSIGQRAEMLLRAGRQDEALRLFDEAMRRAEAAAASEPSPRQTRDFGVARSDYGRALSRVGRTEEAVAIFTTLAREREAVLAANPDSARARRDALLAYQRLGDLEQRRSAYAAALGWHERAADLARTGVETDPNDKFAEYSLTVSLENLTDALVGLERLHAARAAADECVTRRRALVAFDPGNLTWLIALGVAVERSGRVHEAAGELDAAASAFEEAFQIAGSALDTDPTVVLPHQIRVFTAERLGALHGTTDPPSGVAWYRRALETLDRMADNGMAPAGGLPSREAIEALLADLGAEASRS